MPSSDDPKDPRLGDEVLNRDQTRDGASAGQAAPAEANAKRSAVSEEMVRHADDPAGAQSGAPGAAPGEDLPPEAVRALQEAAERRAKADAAEKKAAEKGGPGGPEPTRYGDWERKGRAVDFS